MDSQQLTAMHEQALSLAESGRYDQALDLKIKIVVRQQ